MANQQAGQPLSLEVADNEADDFGLDNVRSL